MNEAMQTGFTLEDLMEIEDTRKYKEPSSTTSADGLTQKEAEILIDRVKFKSATWKPGTIVHPIVDIVYFGRLRDGTEVRTKKIVYSTADVLASEEEGLGKKILDELKRIYPGEGDIVRVYWYSKDPLPKPWARTAHEKKEIYVDLFTMIGDEGSEVVKPEYWRRTPRLQLVTSGKKPTQEVYVPWEILPPREAEQKVRELYSRYRTRYGERGMHSEFDFLKYDPLQVAIGLKEMRGYIAFIFNQYTILENPNIGNAIYIVPASTWQELSKLSRPVLRGIDDVQRIVHDHNGLWQQTLLAYLK